eukprot:1157009-Pelagomonas_calceolata.AAC.13
MQSSITSSAEQALADSERRQQQARQELERSMEAEREKLQQSAAEGKSEVNSRVQALRSENEELLARQPVLIRTATERKKAQQKQPRLNELPVHIWRIPPSVHFLSLCSCDGAFMPHILIQDKQPTALQEKVAFRKASAANDKSMECKRREEYIAGRRNFSLHQTKKRDTLAGKRDEFLTQLKNNGGGAHGSFEPMCLLPLD